MDEKQEMMALPCWRGGDAHPSRAESSLPLGPPDPGCLCSLAREPVRETNASQSSQRVVRRPVLPVVVVLVMSRHHSCMRPLARLCGLVTLPPLFSFLVSRVGLVRKPTTKRSGRPLAGGLRALESGQGQRWSDNSARAKSQDGPLFPDGSPPNPATCRLAKPLASEGVAIRTARRVSCIHSLARQYGNGTWVPIAWAAAISRAAREA